MRDFLGFSFGDPPLVKFYKFLNLKFQLRAGTITGYLYSSFSLYLMYRSSTQRGLSATPLQPPTPTTAPVGRPELNIFLDHTSSMVLSRGVLEMPLTQRMFRSETMPRFRINNNSQAFERLLPRRLNRSFLSVPNNLNNYGASNFRRVNEYYPNERLDYNMFRGLVRRNSFRFSDLYMRPVVLPASGTALVQTNTRDETPNTIFNFIVQNMVDEQLSSLEEESSFERSSIENVRLGGNNNPDNNEHLGWYVFSDEDSDEIVESIYINGEQVRNNNNFYFPYEDVRLTENSNNNYGMNNNINNQGGFVENDGGLDFSDEDPFVEPAVRAVDRVEHDPDWAVDEEAFVDGWNEWDLTREFAEMQVWNERGNWSSSDEEEDMSY